MHGIKIDRTLRVMEKIKRTAPIRPTTTLAKCRVLPLRQRSRPGQCSLDGFAHDLERKSRRQAVDRLNRKRLAGGRVADVVGVAHLQCAAKKLKLAAQQS